MIIKRDQNIAKPVYFSRSIKFIKVIVNFVCYKITQNYKSL